MKHLIGLIVSWHDNETKNLGVIIIDGRITIILLICSLNRFLLTHMAAKLSMTWLAMCCWARLIHTNRPPTRRTRPISTSNLSIRDTTSGVVFVKIASTVPLSSTTLNSSSTNDICNHHTAALYLFTFALATPNHQRWGYILWWSNAQAFYLFTPEFHNLEFTQTKSRTTKSHNTFFWVTESSSMSCHVVSSSYPATDTTSNSLHFIIQFKEQANSRPVSGDGLWTETKNHVFFCRKLSIPKLVFVQLSDYFLLLS